MPVEVHGRADRPTSADVLIAGKACLILALGVVPLRHRRLAVRRARRAGGSGSRRAAARSTRWPARSLVAFVILEAAFLRSDFSFALVASHSSTTTPTFYRATAVWSSQEGSLLLWLLLLALWSSLILFVTRRRLREIAPYATAVLLGLGAFFASLLVFLESPFEQTIGPVPAEGVGLNPLLRHPSMMIHPPMLYSGYTLFAVPFAFAVGALITRRLNADWIRTTRPFTLAAWFFLGVGIVLGARWSYSELGWGGYWAWDPVENASLMPWLTGTAFLHSVMIQEKRGMLKVWNVSLVLATGVLAILGTFLVRSGILESIHAFGASTLGVPFLVLIGTMVAGSVALVVSRAPHLRSEHRLDSLLSREAIFLLNNLVLVALCVVIWWGTFFPLISEALTGRRPRSARRGSTGYRPAGAGARAAVRHRAGDRVAARDARPTCAATSLAPSPWRRRARARAGARRGAAAGRADHVRARRLRARRRRPGVRARRAGAAGDGARAAAGRARVARAAQPPPLRRLPRARRDGGAVRRRRGVLELPDERDVQLTPGQIAPRSAATTSATSSRPPSWWPRPTGGWSGSTSAPSCA